MTDDEREDLEREGDPNWVQQLKAYEERHGYGIAGPLPIAPWPYD